MKKETLDRMRAQLKTAGTHLKELDTDIANARRAEIDVTGLEADARELRKRINKFRSIYGG